MILTILKAAYLELFSGTLITRVPEERLVMIEDERVQQFTDIGKLGGEMTPLYYYRIQNLLKVLAPQDKVLDLGCGSGQLLTLIAECFPEIEFTGIDLSDSMLAQAAQILKHKKLSNLKFKKLDITNLSSEFEPSSFDVVISTDALHHLPALTDLQQTLHEVKKVLKPNGRFSFFDFERMKSYQAISLMITATARKAKPLVKEDFFQSLRAAFSSREFKECLSQAGFQHFKFKTSFPTFMMHFYSPRDATEHDLRANKIKDIFRDAMSFEFKILYYLFSFFSIVRSKN